MDRDDIAQELRIAIVKAASRFDDTKGVSFHTFLHTVMVNTLRTLISKAQRHKSTFETLNIDGVNLDNDGPEYISSSLAESLADTTSLDFMDELELSDILHRAGLDENEKLFLELRLEGTPMERISIICGTHAYKIRAAIQKKLLLFLEKSRRNEHEKEE